MQLSADGRLLLSATDLSDYLACEHLSTLSKQAATGGPRAPYFDDPRVEAIRQRGIEHEQRYLDHLGRNPEARIARIDREQRGASERTLNVVATETMGAMQSGVDVVYQGVLVAGDWIGKPDFLVRVERPSTLGSWSYEVVDAKLAREAKGGATLQVALYSALLGSVQGIDPESMHLVLGGAGLARETLRFADYASYYRSVRRRLEAHVVDARKAATYPEPVAHCDVCAWSVSCLERWRTDDHTSLVAGITRHQRACLAERGVLTMSALGALGLPVEPPIDGVSAVAFERIREQARIQAEARDGKDLRHEVLLPIVNEQGLASLPAPSEGDIFFDIEGDPYATEQGLEYLLGFVESAEGTPYTGLWALDAREEKRTFEKFVDLMIARLERFPDFHIYHYAAYEPSALKRLMGRHATREDEVDRLLRGGVFVDLYRVVRQSLRASVESYSIKKLEPFYDFDRNVELRDASSALAKFEAWLSLGQRGQQDAALLNSVEMYNRDDCLSARALRAWLERQRQEVERLTETVVPRPEPKEGDPSEEVAERQERVQALMSELTAGMPESEGERSPQQQACWLVAQLLEFHRREEKSFWWEHFRMIRLSDEELVEDRSALGGLEYVGVVGREKKSEIHRYRFAPQDHGLRVDRGVLDPRTKKSPGSIIGLDDAAGTIDLKRSKASGVEHPRALIPHDLIGDRVLRESLMRLADSIAKRGVTGSGPHRAARDLLLRHPPRVGQDAGAPLCKQGQDPATVAKRLVLTLDRSVLPVQGPPGAGKTYVGARMILELLKSGKRVGVSGTSHKVISNLLSEVCRAAREERFVFRGIQKGDDDQHCGEPEIELVDKNDKVRSAILDGNAMLAAGTPWLWAREDMDSVIDVLFIDEAGQMSLANVLAIAGTAESLVLLGDPRQLDQPQQGVHPPGAGVSALQHLLGSEPTVPPDGGLFLDQTWRLHPNICRFTSNAFYAGRLHPRPGLERQSLHGPSPFSGNGLRFVAVQHTGHQSESLEEAAVVTRITELLLESRTTWTTASGDRELVSLKDILIVAPYNAQVATIASRLPADARVGTVDKFQGQEAPVVIYSLATSTADDAPRGMEFLYSANRLNVATSRARCLAIVVGSPALFTPRCQTPQQMRLANAFCLFLEDAEVCEARDTASV